MAFVSNISLLQSDNAIGKSSDIIQEVVNELSRRCQCSVEVDQITTAGFICFPESPTAVTFRAKISGSQQVLSSQLISFLEEWTSSSVRILVQAQLLSVDGSCDVEISSASDPECVSVSTTSTPSPPVSTPPSRLNVTLISIIAVVAILVLSLTIIVAVLALLLARWKHKRKGTVELQTMPLPQPPAPPV